MKLSQIQGKARKLGIKNSWKYSKRDLIKNIQRTEGNFDCFGTATDYCDQFTCSWRGDCLKIK